MISDNDIVNKIKEIINLNKKRYGIINEIIRDDVFQVLQDCNCTVLYYPLQDEEIDGCHIEKPVNDKIEQFVFINTINTRERQAFSAAHELGHMWKVYDSIKEEFSDLELEEEEIINRFAAELMMPEVLFRQVVDLQLDKMRYTGPKIEIRDLIKLIAYLMNYFFVPYKSVVFRFNELHKLNKKYNDRLLKYKDSDLLNEIINAEQYTRLGIVNKLKSMDNIQEYIDDAEREGFISEKKAENIREIFAIRPISKTDDIHVEF